MKELEYIRTDKNGTKYYNDWNCPRCGGAGSSSMWFYTGGRCYECDGSGLRKNPKVVKVYTPEHAAKLDEQLRQKREKKIEQRRAEGYAKKAKQYGFGDNGVGYVYTGNTYAIKEQLKQGGARYSFALRWVSPQPIGSYPCIEIAAADVFDFFDGSESWDLSNPKCEAWKEAHGLE